MNSVRHLRYFILPHLFSGWRHAVLALLAAIALGLLVMHACGSMTMPVAVHDERPIQAWNAAVGSPCTKPTFTRGTPEQQMAHCRCYQCAFFHATETLHLRQKDRENLAQTCP